MGGKTAMIVCPNCNHQNPDGAIQCEDCLTPLPAMSTCPNCGASVQTDATFCGQCGFDLRANAAASGEESASAAPYIPPTVVSAPPLAATVAAPPLPAPDPLVTPEPLVASTGEPSEVNQSASLPEPTSPPPVPASSEPVAEEPESPPIPLPTPQAAPAARSSKTQLQTQTAKLLHVQTNTEMEFPQNVSVIHIGKPNDMVPPDLDVSGFPNSEIVSRIHADIRVEGDGYYLEDVGSSNGTYVNNFPLPKGNRHRLRLGDRIALGKGDMVTFLFQIS